MLVLDVGFEGSMFGVWPGSGCWNRLGMGMGG